METDKRWRIDKHINVSVILVVVIQYTGFIYWVSTIDHVTETHADRISKLERWQAQRIRDNSNLMQRIASTESKIEYVGERIGYLQTQSNRIETKLDQALDRIANGSSKSWSASMKPLRHGVFQTKTKVHRDTPWKGGK